MALRLKSDPYHWVAQAEHYVSKGLAEPYMVPFAKDLIGLEVESSRRPIFAFTKRLFDFFLALVLLTVLSPLLLAVSVLIWLGDRGPIFYSQPRLGRDFAPFWIWKFRTLAPNSDSIGLKDTPLEKGGQHSLSTNLGTWLRRYKIDEIPQLINVIKGEMSLVGPRPLSIDESLTTHPRRRVRFSVLPGMTGLWQAFRTNSISGRRRIALDARYVRIRGWGIDLKILLNTLWVCLRGEVVFASTARGLRTVREPSTKQIQLLNIMIDDIPEGDLFFRMAKYGGVVFTPNVDHMVRLLEKSNEFRHLYAKASFAVCDSRVIQILSWITSRPIQFCHRGSDLLPRYFRFLSLGSKPLKAFVLGGDTQNVCELACEVLRKESNGMAIIKGLSPPMGFDSTPGELERVVDELAQFSPEVLVIGIGSPRQERLAFALKKILPTIRVVLPLGASVNFLGGFEKRAPVWMQKVGLEWFFRFTQNPARLFWRYFVRDLQFLGYWLLSSF